MITCPAGRGAVPTGYRTTDVDLARSSQSRSFRCICGAVHVWTEGVAWAEAEASKATRLAYGL